MLSWDRRTQAILAVVGAVLVFACGVKWGQWRSGPGLGEEAAVVAAGEPSPAEEESPQLLGVHVAGAVARPGVYYLPQGKRVVDAVDKAGPLPDADLQALNLARPLSDGEKIYVPRVGEMPPAAGVQASGAAGAAGSGEARVNINTATAEELDARLPGIGPVLARRIVEYREKHGPFKSPEDLQNVSGIGPKRFEQLKELITT